MGRSSLCLLLLLAFLSVAVATQPKQWLACTWPSPSSSSSSSSTSSFSSSSSSSSSTSSSLAELSKIPMDELVRQFHVHGIFQRVFFLVDSAENIPLVEALGFRAQAFREFRGPIDQLRVVEFNRKITHVARRDFFRIEQLKKALVFAAFDNHLVVIDSSIDFDDVISQLSWRDMVEVIELRNTHIAPPRRFEETRLYPYLSNLAPNPVISDVIQEVSSSNLEDLVYHLSENYHTRVSASKELKEAQAYLVNTFRSLGLNVTTQNYWENYADNVCADLIGTENPESIVMAGAHYDSRSTSTSDVTLRAPGAVDNGSGTAGMVEMARIVSESGVKFSNTIRFCVWTGEEQGLLGSAAYATKMVNEDADIIAYFNADMTGYKLPNSPRITMGMKDSSVTQWLLTLSFEITEMYVPDLLVDLSSSCCSDYISFYNNGYPAIGYFQNPGSASDYPSYHKSSDTYEKNNYEQIRLETQAILAAVLVHAVPL